MGKFIELTKTESHYYGGIKQPDTVQKFLVNVDQIVFVKNWNYPSTNGFQTERVTEIYFSNYPDNQAIEFDQNFYQIMAKIREGELDGKVPIKEGDNGYDKLVELDVLVGLLKWARNDLDKARVALDAARAELK